MIWIVVLIVIQEIYVKAKEKYVGYLESIETEGLDGYAKELLDLKNEQQKEIDALNDAYAKKLMDKETYEQMMADIEKRYNKKRQDAWVNSDDYKSSKSLMGELYSRDVVEKNAVDAMSGSMDVVGYYKSIIEQMNDATRQLSLMDPDSDEYKTLSANIDGMYELLESKGMAIVDIAADIGSAIGSGIAGAVRGEVDDVRDAFKSLLKVILDAIEKMMIAAISERTIKNVGTLGLPGLLKAAPEIALITAAFEAVKGLIDGFESGGYTGVGAHDAPAGIVHKGEFVANRFALANPDIKAVLDLVDAAQRKGNVQNLTAEDIRAVSGHGSAGGAAISRPVVNVTTDNSRLESVLRNVESTMAEAVDAYKQPSPAYCYLDGDGGINRQQELLQKMKSNARR